MTLEPGSFPWACQMMLEGKTVERDYTEDGVAIRAQLRADIRIEGRWMGGDNYDFCKWEDPASIEPCDLEATNWRIANV